jgi:hypothetical protein
MNAALRHLSVRLWLTAFAGALTGILVLPWWQQIGGVDWLGVPAAVLMGGCFACVGWVMNRIGMGFLKRHVNEAKSWERAGMPAELEAALSKAMATFDSFWLSPLLRRGKLMWFSALMARFYLGQPTDSIFARSLIATHLLHFPQDVSAAEPWLEQLLAYERHLPIEHEAVVLISYRLGRHKRIQRLLMQFYILNGRADFDAMQIYRRVWHGHGPLPRETVNELAGLLLNEYVLSHWALHVYLKAYESGDNRALEGIAAAVRWLPATEESRPHLNTAEKILAAVDQPPPEASILKLKPEKESRPGHRQPSRPGAAFKTKVNRSITHIFSFPGHRRGPGVRPSTKQQAVLTVNFALAIVAAVLIVSVTVVAGWRIHNRPTGQSFASSEKVKMDEKVAEKVVITDPFTIQVAAYLKFEDARRLVDQLVQKELDAFWTQAKSANRTWYQVKVSHFATREAAQAYGQEL